MQLPGNYKTASLNKLRKSWLEKKITHSRSSFPMRRRLCAYCAFARTFPNLIEMIYKYAAAID